jgi:hypothetical protein
VQCNNDLRADRLCTWPNVQTDCGLTGSNGCVPCGGTWAGPSGGTVSCGRYPWATYCEWQGYTPPPPTCKNLYETCYNDCCPGLTCNGGWGGFCDI